MRQSSMKMFHLVFLSSSVLSFVLACGSREGVRPKQKAVVNTSDLSDADTQVVFSLGKGVCGDDGVTVLRPGAQGSIPIIIKNADKSQFAIGFLAQPNTPVQSVQVDFTSVRFLAPSQPGTYQVEVVLRDQKKCQAFNQETTQFNCDIRGPVSESHPQFDLTQKAQFVVIALGSQTLNDSQLGRGQTGIISDLVNQEGLIGTLGGMLGGNGGLMGGLLGGGQGTQQGGTGGLLGGGQGTQQGTGGLGGLLGGGQGTQQGGTGGLLGGLGSLGNTNGGMGQLLPQQTSPGSGGNSDPQSLCGF